MKVKAALGILALFACTLGYSEANTVRTCHSCYGINCQRTTLNETKSCLDSLDYCVSIYAQAKVLYKGCSLEIPKALRPRCESHERDSCYKCNSDRCNNLGSPAYACVQCDSSSDSNCAENASQVVPTACAAPSASNSYCYVKTSNSGTSVQRGCSTTVVDQQSCLNDANCLLCSPGDIRGCNNVNVATDTSNRSLRFLR